MLNKILIFLACFFAILAVCLFFWVNIQGKRIDSLKSAKTMLESNNNLLINRLEREHNDKMEVDRRAKAIAEAVKKSTGDFDWYYNLSNNSVLITFKRLHSKEGIR